MSKLWQGAVNWIKVHPHQLILFV